MATIGKVSAVFTASTSGLTAGVNRAGSSFKQLEASVKSLRGSMGSLVAIQGAQLFGSVISGVSSAVSSFAGMAKAQAEVIDGNSKLAARLGMTYKEVAGLALAGDLAGVSMESIATAATKADVAFVRAAEGSKTATAAFDSIGLSVEKLNGLSAAERFETIVDAIAGLPTEAQKAEAAVQLFGRAGAQLLPLFSGGAAGIREAREEAERFGLALTNEQGRNVEAMNDAFTRAQQAIAGVVNQVVAYLAPAIESVTTQFSDLVGSVGGANIGQAIGEALLQGARFLAEIGDSVIANFGGVFQYLSNVGGQWNAVWEFGSRVASFFAGIGDSLQAAFGVLILGLTGPVQALIEAAKAIGDWTGFDTSGFDTYLEGMRAFNNTISDGITENINSAADNFNRALFGDSDLNKAGQAIAGPLTQAVDGMIGAAREAAGSIDEATRSKIEVKQVVQLDGVAQAVKGIESTSQEGVREMFRLMRGDTGNSAAERTASAAERTADAIEGLELEFDVFGLAPAAGA